MKSTIIKAAVEAGNLLMSRFKKIQKINIKNKTSLVTNVDIESDKLIKKIIFSKYPSHNIVSEETSRIDNGSDYTWHIDPVDGTHNYTRGIPLFGVSIALEHNGKFILGAINLPYFKRIYFAEKGKGAFCNDKTISVSDKSDLNFAFIVLDLNHKARANSIKFIKKIKSTLVDIRNFGCAVYGLAEIAHGNLDAYVIQNTNSWDVAAGFLLIEEANGKVTNHKNEIWSINERAFLATNGKIHDKILMHLT